MIDFDKVKRKVEGTEITMGAVLKSDGSTERTKTGGWRALKPITDHDKCTGCAICWIYCPDMSRYKDKDGKFETDWDYCKGCGICAKICPVKAIEMITEEK